MLIDTNDLVSATDFNRNTGRYTALAAEGRRIVVIVKDQQLVAALVGIHDLNRLDALDGAPELALDEVPGEGDTTLSEPPPGGLLLGHTVTGQAAYIDPRQNLMVVGRGASDFMSVLLARVGEMSADLNLQFVIANEHALQLPRPSTPDRAPTILSVILDVANARTHFCRLGDQVDGEIDRRTALLAESSVNTIDEHRRLDSDSPANLVIVVDDADQVDPGILNKMVSEISRSGEKLGISVWLFAATASPRGVLPAAGISQRVALPMETPAQSRDVVYSDIAYRLKPGQAALLKRGGDLSPFRTPTSENLTLTPAVPTAAPELQWSPLPTSPPLDSIVGDSDQANDGSAPRLPIGVIDQPRLHSHPVYALTLTPGELTDVYTDDPMFERAFIDVVLRSASLAVSPSAQGVRFLYIGPKPSPRWPRGGNLLRSYTWDQFVGGDGLSGGHEIAHALNEIPEEAHAADSTTVLIANMLGPQRIVITDLLEKAMREDNFHVLLLRRGGLYEERMLRGAPQPATTIYSRGSAGHEVFLDHAVRQKVRKLPHRNDAYDAITSSDGYGHLVLAQ